MIKCCLLASTAVVLIWSSCAVAQPVPSGATPTTNDLFEFYRAGTPNFASLGSLAAVLPGGGSSPVTPEQFGAVGNGVADDTAAVQAAINYVALGYAGSVYLPNAYAVSSTILVEYASILIIGNGWGIYDYVESLALTKRVSMLIWIGNTTDPLIRIKNNWGSSVKSIRLVNHSSSIPSAAIAVTQTLVGNTQNMVLRNTVVDNVYIGSFDGYDGGDTVLPYQFTAGIQWDTGPNGDTNTISNTVISQVAVGIDVHNVDAASINLQTVWIGQCGIGIRTATNIVGNNVLVLGSTVADLVLDGSQGSPPSISLTGYESVQGANFCQIYGSGQAQLILRDSALQWGATTQADGRLIYCVTETSLVDIAIENSFMFGDASVTNTVTSGSYNSGTGVVTLNFATAPTLAVGAKILFEPIGTGNVNLTSGFGFVLGISGSSVTLQGPTGKTMTITGGTLTRIPIIQPTFPGGSTSGGTLRLLNNEGIMPSNIDMGVMVGQNDQRSLIYEPSTLQQGVAYPRQRVSLDYRVTETGDDDRSYKPWSDYSLGEMNVYGGPLKVRRLQGWHSFYIGASAAIGSGATTYTYQVVGYTYDGAVSSALQTCTNASSLSAGVAANRVTFAQVLGAYKYDIFGRTGGSLGLLATFSWEEYVLSQTYSAAGWVDDGSISAGVAPPAASSDTTGNALIDGVVQASSSLNLPVAFSGLPATPVDGQRAYVTNSSTNTFGATADGAGAHHVPVWYSSEATSWLVG